MNRSLPAQLDAELCRIPNAVMQHARQLHSVPGQPYRGQQPTVADLIDMIGQALPDATVVPFDFLTEHCNAYGHAR